MKKILTIIVIFFIICVFAIFVLFKRDRGYDNLKEATLADTTLTSGNDGLIKKLDNIFFRTIS